MSNTTHTNKTRKTLVYDDGLGDKVYRDFKGDLVNKNGLLLSIEHEDNIRAYLRSVSNNHRGNGYSYFA